MSEVEKRDGAHTFYMELYEKITEAPDSLLEGAMYFADKYSDRVLGDLFKAELFRRRQRRAQDRMARNQKANTFYKKLSESECQMTRERWITEVSDSLLEGLIYLANKKSDMILNDLFKEELSRRIGRIERRAQDRMARLEKGSPEETAEQSEGENDAY